MLDSLALRYHPEFMTPSCCHFFLYSQEGLEPQQNPENLPLTLGVTAGISNRPKSAPRWRNQTDSSAVVELSSPRWSSYSSSPSSLPTLTGISPSRYLAATRNRPLLSSFCICTSKEILSYPRKGATTASRCAGSFATIQCCSSRFY